MLFTCSLSQELIKKLLIGSVCLPVVLQFMPVQAFPLSGDKTDKPKNSKLQLPINEPLSLGAGPQTNDKNQKGTAGSADLSPINLGNSSQQPASPAAADESKETDAAVLNGSVKDTEFAQSKSTDKNGGDEDSVMAPKSIKDDKGASTSDPTKVSKIELEPTADEAEKKVETLLDMERAELSDLWDSTLVRSKDIQFVVSKLAPTKAPAATGDKGLIKNLGDSIFNASGAFSSLSRGVVPGTSGADLVKSVLVQGSSETAKKANITENEAIQLYNMIRNTAKALVDNYYSYKKYRNALSRAGIDLLDLQAMVRDASGKANPVNVGEIDYIIRKQNREIDSLKEEMGQTRGRLVELAGDKAITRLDTQIDLENGKIDNQTHIGDAPAAGATAQ